MCGFVEKANAARDHIRSVFSGWYLRPTLQAGGLFALLAILPAGLEVRVFGFGLDTLLSLQLLTLTLLWATASQSWNIVSGFAGQFSLGHAAFFGLGAYVPLLLAREFSVSPWIGFLAGAMVAALYALCIGVLSFRYDLRGGYFALITLAFAQLLFYVFINVDRLGGASGVIKPLPDAYGAEFGIFAFQFSTKLPYYYVILAFLCIVTITSLAIKRSQIGLYLQAIRDDEAAASAVGIPVFRYKLFALVVSAFFTAWAGSFWAMYFTAIRPSVVFSVLVSFDILLPAAIGGIGTLFGPILGAFALTIVSEAGRLAVTVPELKNIVGGVLLLIVVLKSPGGLVTWAGRFAGLLDRLRDGE